MKTLKALDISPRLYSFGHDPYLSLAPQLEEFAGKNVLESLKFRIWVDFLTPIYTDPAEWEKLDDILSKSDGFPFLRRVEITVRLGNYNPIHQELEKELRNRGRRHFPSLSCDGFKESGIWKHQRRSPAVQMAAVPEDDLITAQAILAID